MEFVEFLKSWGVPAGIVTGILVFVAILNFIYFLMDKGGKTVTSFLNIYKWWKERKQQKQDLSDFLKEIKGHYSPENIKKRNEWMDWVNEKAEKYDSAVDELRALESVFQVNNKLTEEMYIQNCRTIIIDFAHKVRDTNYIASEEEYKRVFNVHDEYEKFNAAHNRTNGETDRAMKVINKRYNQCMMNSTFLEDIRKDLFVDDDDL